MVILSSKFIVTIPVRTPDGKGSFKAAQGLIHIWHRNNYDWMLFLTSPMAFTGDKTHDFVFTKQTL